MWVGFHTKKHDNILPHQQPCFFFLIPLQIKSVNLQITRLFPVFSSRWYFLSVVARVWNEAAAHRLTTLGHSARRGDLVWLPGEQLKAEGTEETTLPQVTHRDGSHVRPALCPLFIRYSGKFSVRESPGCKRGSCSVWWPVPYYREGNKFWQRCFLELERMNRFDVFSLNRVMRGCILFIWVFEKRGFSGAFSSLSDLGKKRHFNTKIFE